MNSNKKGSTTRLPAALRDELGFGSSSSAHEGEDGSSRRRQRAALFAARGAGSGRGRGGPTRQTTNVSRSTYASGFMGRKEARKAQRQEKKHARSQQGAVGAPNGHRNAQRSWQSEEKRPQQTYRKTGSDNETLSLQKQDQRSHADAKGKGRAIEEQITHSSRGQQKHVAQDEVTPLERLLKRQLYADASEDEEVENEAEASPNNSGKRKSSRLTAAERNEEDEIAWLESHLGMSRRKKAKVSVSSRDIGQSAEEEDGLDELLDDLDRFHPGMYDDDGDDDDDDDDDDEEEDDDDKSENLDAESEDNDIELSDENSLSGDDYASDDVDVIHDDDESQSIDEDLADEPRDDMPITSLTDVKSSVEVPSTSKSEARYISPALRKAAAAVANGQDASSEEERKLKRSAKGILNRLGDSNIGNVVGETEDLYRQYSRAQTSSCLTQLVLDAIVTSGEGMSLSLIVLHATFATALHRIVGVEFGAYFVQELVDRFLQQYESANAKQQADQQETIDTEGSIGKTSRNLAYMLASLYNLEVVGCPLVYDIVRLLLGVEARSEQDARKQSKSKGMSELDVELLLAVVKACGPQLRHDDPTSLKAIVQIAQERQSDSSAVASQSGQPVSMRAKFMLESLSDLRNNRSRATTASVDAEMLTKMRKFVSGLSKKHTIRTYEPLRVGLKDLRNVDKRGKWWLVGAAWAGYDFSEQNQTQQHDKPLTTNKIGSYANNLDDQTENANEAKLLALARQHGMNTVLRQQIFVTLLSSEDYLDAVQRLLALTHKKATQRREIVRVLLHCLGVEPTFNPFYVVVATRLASEDATATRITLQFCLWDFLRKLGERQVGGQSIVGAADDVDFDDVEGAFGGTSSEEQVQNVARAYGWWFAKGALHLDALRAVDFTTLKHGKRFLQLLFVYMLLSTYVKSPVQTLNATSNKNSTSPFPRMRQNDDMAAMSSSKDDQAVEQLFVQGTRTNQRVAKGLVIFFETRFKTHHCRALANEIGLKQSTQDVLLHARTVALETVRIGSRLAANEEDMM